MLRVFHPVACSSSVRVFQSILVPGLVLLSVAQLPQTASGQSKWLRKGINNIQNNVNQAGKAVGNAFNNSPTRFHGGGQGARPQPNYPPSYNPRPNAGNNSNSGNSPYRYDYIPPQNSRPQPNYPSANTRPQNPTPARPQWGSGNQNNGWAAELGRNLGKIIIAGQQNQQRPQPQWQQQQWQQQRPQQQWQQPQWQQQQWQQQQWQQQRPQQQPQTQFYPQSHPQVVQRPQPQVVQQPQVVTTASAVSVPRNVIPRNAPTQRSFSLTPTSNELPGQKLLALSSAEIERLTPEISSLMQQSHDEFLELRDELLDRLTEEFFDAPQISSLMSTFGIEESLAQALKDRDFDAVDDLLEQATENLRQQVADGSVPEATLVLWDQARKMLDKDFLGPIRDLNATTEELSQALQSGESLEAIQPTIRRMREILNEKGLAHHFDHDLVGPMRDSLERIDMLLHTEEQLLAGPPSVPPIWSWSDQPIWILHDPNLQPGQFFYGGEEVVVVHAADGQFGVQQGTFAEALELPIGVGNAANTAKATTFASDVSSRLLIRNPEENGQDVSFQIDGQNYSLAAGAEQELTITGKRVLKYDPGKEGMDTQQFTVESGSYNFRLRAEEGWKFFSAKFNVNINNTKGRSTFHFLADGAASSVAPGETLKISAAFPPVVQFDPGDGADPVARRLDKPDYTVAIDPQHGRWDLFATVTIAGQPPEEDVTNQASLPQQSGREPPRRPRWQSSSSKAG